MNVCLQFIFYQSKCIYNFSPRNIMTYDMLSNCLILIIVTATKLRSENKIGNIFGDLLRSQPKIRLF